MGGSEQGGGRAGREREDGGAGNVGRHTTGTEWSSGSDQAVINHLNVSNFLDFNHRQGEGGTGSGVGNVNENSNSMADGSRTSSK